MKDSAYVQVKGDLTEMRFEWIGLDGDDCFSDFHIDVRNEVDSKRFDFGPCAVHGLRKLRRFFEDPTQTKVGLGFRHPDIRCCDVYRSDHGYRLVVRFEGSQLHEQVDVFSPLVQIDDEFLKLY